MFLAAGAGDPRANDDFCHIFHTIEFFVPTEGVSLLRSLIANFTSSWAGRGYWNKVGVGVYFTS